jgi:hypothetical protein
MWIFTRLGFFSIVCANESETSSKLDQTQLMIRSRSRKQLEALKARFTELAKYPIKTNTGTDYPCRLIVERGVFEKVMAVLTSEIDYGNFKNAAGAQPGADEYHYALNEVWTVMRNFQNEDVK